MAGGLKPVAELHAGPRIGVLPRVQLPEMAILREAVKYGRAKLIEQSPLLLGDGRRNWFVKFPAYRARTYRHDCRVQ